MQLTEAIEIYNIPNPGGRFWNATRSNYCESVKVFLERDDDYWINVEGLGKKTLETIRNVRKAIIAAQAN